MAKEVSEEKIKERLADEKRTARKKSLSYSIADGSAYSAMEGFSKAYIVPFALALKASTTMVGIISSLPDLLGSVFQLITTGFVEKIKSRKGVIVFCALIQAILWLPLFFIPLVFQNYGPAIVLLFVTLQAIMAYTINPLWNSLMGDLVPEDERGRYFGKRNTITGISVFVSTFLAGIVINQFTNYHPMIGFGVLFGIAFVSRLVSAYYLNKMYDAEYVVDKSAYFSFSDFLKRMSHNNYGRFTLYVCIMNFVVYIASPFYTVYMLRDLHFSYIIFMLITLSSLISSFFGMYFWGKFNDRHGSKSLLYISGFLVPFGATLWFFTKNPCYLIAIEAFSGFAWAGFNLSTANFIFDATTPQKRTRCIIYFNVLKGTAIFLGAIFGGVLANHLPNLWFVSSLPILFLISGVSRFVISLVFLPLLREMRLIEVPVGHSMIRSHLTIKPNRGIIYEVIGTHPRPVKESKESDMKKKKRPPLGSEPTTDKEKTNSQLVGYLQSEMKKKK